MIFSHLWNLFKFELGASFLKRWLTFKEGLDVVLGAVVRQSPQSDDALGRLAAEAAPVAIVVAAALVHHPLHFAVLGAENWN